MSLSLQTFAVGDTNYISKHNSNNSAIAAAVDALGESGLSVINSLNQMIALYGTGTTLIGDYSFAISGTGTTLTVQAGTVWRADLGAILNKGTSTSLSFVGQGAATYYIVCDGAGNPTISASPIGAMYSVAWNGTTTLSAHALVAAIYLAPDIETIAYAASVTVDWRQYRLVKITLTGNITFNQTFGVSGERYTVEFTQDGSGSHLLTLGAEARLGTTLASSTLTTTINKMDRLVFQYHAGSGKYDLVEFNKGF